MNTIRQSFTRGLYVAVIGCITLFSTTGETLEGTLLHFTGDPPQSLLDSVSQEFHCEHQLDWYYNLEDTLVVKCYRDRITLEAHLYGSTSVDLNGDGRNDLIIGLTFPGREQTAWKEDDLDLLLMYTVEDDGTVRQVFRKEFDPGEQGGIRQLWLEDITGDENAEILCVHWNAYRGRFGADITAQYIIIGGHQPFTVLADLGVGGISHYPQKNVKQADVHFQDRDGDGLQEIILTWSEGPDTFSLSPVSSAPDIYHATFTLTSVVLKALQQVGLPEETLQVLHALQDREFLAKQTFLQTVKQHIGSDAVAQYGDVIVQSAIGPYQLQHME